MPAGFTPRKKAEALAQQRIQAFVATFGKAFPAAVHCLLDDHRR